MGNGQDAKIEKKEAVEAGETTGSQIETEREKTAQERYKPEQEKYREDQAKADQEIYKAEQEKSRVEQEKLIVQKRKLELEILKKRYKKRKCFICFLSILVGAFSVVLIVEGICIFCSIKEAWDNTYNWIRLIFGSVMMVSFVVLIIALCFFIKKLLSQSDEE